VQRVAADHHLQTVVVGRVVAAGDLHAGAGVEMEGGVVEHRRRRQADVDDLAAGGLQPLGEVLGQLGARQAPVAADHHTPLAAGLAGRAEGAADLAHDLRPQVLGHHPADVVGTKDCR